MNLHDREILKSSEFVTFMNAKFSLQTSAWLFSNYDKAFKTPRYDI